MLFRPRRLRSTAILRNAIAETHVSKEAFIYPFFVCKGADIQQPIQAMPNIFQWGASNKLVREVEKCLQLGINKILLFGVNDHKSEQAESAYDNSSSVPTALRLLKAEFGNDLYIITDVCLCAYTTHGHCGVIHRQQVNNDATLGLLAQMALTHAQAGADMVAPSDMMDGRVGAIRNVLDNNDLEHIPIMSYSIKYASAYYGPFREAANSAPQYGDRKTYQMDFRNVAESLREAELDIAEGADILMVKPALAYLDIMYRIKQQTHLPLACYNVSGEYSMIKMAAQAHLINEPQIVMENMNAFTRAGANLIISYHTKDIFEQKWI